jgi:hypothetical protein
MVPDRYMARLAELGVMWRSTEGNWDASHKALDLFYGTRDPVSLENYNDITRLRPDDRHATAATLPERYWFDGRPWSAFT